MVRWAYERERERERKTQSGTAMIDTTLKQTYSEPYLFMVFTQKADTGSASQPRDSHTWLTPKTTWHVYSADCFPWLTTGVKNFRHYIFLWYPRISSHAIHMAFLLSLVYLKTQLHNLFFEIQLTWPVKGQYVTLETICKLISSSLFKKVI